MRPSLRHLFLVVPPLIASGCAAAVAGAGVGFILSQKVLPNDAHVAQVRLDVDQVWPSVVETVSFFSDPGEELEVQDYPRVVRTQSGGAKITVRVEALEADRTQIRVEARKLLTSDGETAERVMSKILDRLGD